MAVKVPFKDAIVRIKNELNIVDVLINDGIHLAPAGNGRWKAVCPFHLEKTPSFIVSEEYQSYRCFGCGVSGDVIDYMKNAHQTDTKQAVEFLAESIGLEIDFDNGESFARLDSLLKATEKMADFFIKQFKKLPPNHPAVLNITERGLSPQLGGYGWGGGPNELFKYLKNAGFDLDLLNEQKILSNPRVFQERLIFIYRDYMGRPVGFVGRQVMPEDTYAKYINSAASVLYNKSKILYNLSEAKRSAREKGEIYIVEGSFDVHAMVERGYENTVASSGTAITALQIAELMKATDNGNIIFILDSDEAGVKALYSVFQKFPIIHDSAFWIRLADKKDPCEWLKSNLKLPSRVSLLDAIFSLLLKDCKIKTTTDKAQCRKKMISSFFQYLPDIMIKREYIKKLAQFLGVEESDLTDIVLKGEKKSNQLLSDEGGESTAADMERQFYISALSHWVSYRENMNDEVVSKKEYPPSLHTLIDELKGYKDKETLFPEMFTNPKLAKALFKIETDNVFNSPEQILNHYCFLLGEGKRLTKERIDRQKEMELMEALTNK